MLLTLPRQQSVQANPITFYAPIVSIGPHLLLRAAMPVPLYLIDLRPSQLLVAPEDHREQAEPRDRSLSLSSSSLVPYIAHCICAAQGRRAIGHEAAKAANRPRKVPDQWDLDTKQPNTAPQG
jgi:hypothetical protein